MIAKRLTRILLAFALACGLLPGAAFADEALPVLNEDESASATESSYTEGEALVVYHDASANGVVPLSDDEVPSTLADAGVQVLQTWDLSAPESLEAQENGIAPLSDDSEPAQNEIDRAAARVLPAGDDVRVALVTDEAATTVELIERLEQMECVEAVAPNYTRTIAADASVAANVPVPVDDPLFGYQFGMGDDIGGVHLGSALQADVAAGGAAQDNVVAVIDTGVDYTHPDLENHMWTNDGSWGLPGDAGSHGYDYGDLDSDVMPGPSFAASHGTHCSGIIAAQTNNGMGVAAPAQHTEIMALKVAPSESATGSFGDVALVAAYNYVIQAAVAGVNVVAINGSWHLGSHSPVIDYLVNQAGKAGIVSVIAAGNEGVDTEPSGTYSGTAGLESPYAIMVGASNAANDLWVSSNYNETQIDLAAPGASIMSTVSTGAADVAFSAQVSKAAGITGMPYCANMGELARDGKYAVDIRYLEDPLEPVDTSAVVLTQTTTPQGEDAVEVRLDQSKLDHPALKYTVKLSWTIANPFLGSALSASDYAISMTPSLDRATMPADLIVQAHLQLKSTDGSQSYANEKAGSACLVDNYQIGGTTIDAINTADAELVAGCYIAFGSSSDVVPAVVLADYAIGVKSTDYVPYGYMSGTSMATPAVAGSFAELASLYPDESPLELRGRVVGGTVPLATAADQGKIASGGRFSFDVALDDGVINANTWAVDCDVATREVKVLGRDLSDATLTVDDVPMAATSNAAGSTLSFAADAALFDGGRHRFDVTDGSTGRLFRASYTVPLIDEQSEVPPTSTALSKVMDLPEASATSGTGVLVACGDRLFYADAYGTYLYSCADPAAADATWKQLDAPGLSYLTSQGMAGNDRRTSLRFACLDGTLYAFGCDARGDEGDGAAIGVFCAAYDIVAGTWSAFKEVDRLSADGGGAIGLTRVPNPVAYNGMMHLAVVSSITDANGAETETTYLLSGTADGSFATETFRPEDLSDFSLTNLYADGQLHALVGGTQKGSSCYALTTYADGSWSSPTVLENGPTFTGSEADDFIEATKAETGAGLLVVGRSFAGIGDALLLDASILKWTGLGSFGLSQSDGFVVSSAIQMGDSAYVSALDATLANEAASRASADETTCGALYALPKDVTAKLGSLERTATAAADAGGTAKVADWHGVAASELVVRASDHVTWSAEPSSGFAFEGWYDGGTLVSSEAIYCASVLTDTSLTARFAAEPASKPSSDNSPKATALVRTGDYTAPVAGLLILLVAAAAATGIVVRRRRL